MKEVLVFPCRVHSGAPYVVRTGSKNRTSLCSGPGPCKVCVFVYIGIFLCTRSIYQVGSDAETLPFKVGFIIEGRFFDAKFRLIEGWVGISLNLL